MWTLTSVIRDTPKSSGGCSHPMTPRDVTSTDKTCKSGLNVLNNIKCSAVLVNSIPMETCCIQLIVLLRKRRQPFGTLRVKWFLWITQFCDIELSMCGARVRHARTCTGV